MITQQLLSHFLNGSKFLLMELNLKLPGCVFFICHPPRVCICGYPRQQMRRYKGISTRLTVTSEFLVQLITGIHYAL